MPGSSRKKEDKETKIRKDYKRLYREFNEQAYNEGRKNVDQSLSVIDHWSGNSKIDKETKQEEIDRLALEKSKSECKLNWKNNENDQMSCAQGAYDSFYKRRGEKYGPDLRPI